jgi:NADH:ubiquinone reductase (H+-translocating)
MAWNVVIAGGGFGGYYAARTLERKLPPHSAKLTLVTDVNFLLYTPLLPGAAGGTLEPRHVVVPLREELKQTDLRLGQVLGANPATSCLKVQTLEGHEEDLYYDQLVVALGSVSRTFPIPGLKEHAIGFKTLPEAIALRNRVIGNLERAETLDDETDRAPYLTFVFVGAGYAGVEALAEVQDFMAAVLDRYPRCRTQGIRFMLVEARDRIMAEIPLDLADFAARDLRGRGIEIRTDTQVEEVTPSSVALSTGEVVPTRNLVWTAGVKPHPSIRRLGLPLDETGRIRTNRAMRVVDRPNVWAIGDAASVPDPANLEKPCPPTAQHAVRQGRRVAKNVAAELGAGGTVRPFTYKTKGAFVDMGRYEAVASTMGLKWRGFPAWLMARTYHLMLMPGVKRKYRLLIDWNVDLLFSRDTSELGQLGHPPTLDGGGLEAHSAGGTTEPGHVAGDEEGARRNPEDPAAGGADSLDGATHGGAAPEQADERATETAEEADVGRS